MRFEIEGRQYRIEFTHYNPPPCCNKLDCKCTRQEDEPYPGTDCFILEGAIEAPIAVGQAFLSPKDRFEKETGRKVALTRALKAVGWPAGHREIAWKAYLSRKIVAQQPTRIGA